MWTQKAFISLENQQNIIRMGIIFFFRPDSTIANKWDATYFHFTQKKIKEMRGNHMIFYLKKCFKNLTEEYTSLAYQIKLS